MNYKNAHLTDSLLLSLIGISAKATVKTDSNDTERLTGVIADYSGVPFFMVDDNKWILKINIIDLMLLVDTIPPHNKSYVVWEHEIIDIISSKMECANTDAQGIFQAQMFYANQAWNTGLNAIQAYEHIYAKAWQPIPPPSTEPCYMEDIRPTQTHLRG